MDDVVKELDCNGDGRISFEEFLTWWQLGLSPAALLDDAVASGLREKGWTAPDVAKLS